ncbi:MAG: Fic family protein [Blastocatellia bacterium]
MNSVTHAQKELAALQLTPERQQDLNRRVDVEFTWATLALEGSAVSREEVERESARTATLVSSAGEGSTRIISALYAIRSVRSLAEARGTAASLTPSLLLELHSGSDVSSKEPSRQPTPEQAGATRLLATLESLCHWFTAESFAELHPAEQASIVLLRLLELKPFDEGNTRTALAVSSLYTLRSQLPPIIIRPEMQAAYRAALNEGVKMNTKPMVDLVAEALVRTVRELVERAGVN